MKVLHRPLVDVVVSLGCLFLRPALAGDTLVVQWNNAALEAIRTTRTAPTIAARALAIAHTCMYDAWTFYDPVAAGTRLGTSWHRPAAERTQTNKEKAISYAAYRCLTDLFPSQAAALTALLTGLGFNPNDLSLDPTTASGLGNLAAAAVVMFRHNDSSNQLGNLNPGAYSDYTGYAPVNTVDEITDPNRWQPLRQPDGTPQTFLTPHWGLVAPFAINPASRFRPQPPPQFPHGTYRQRALEIIHLSGHLDDLQKMIAEYWADGPATETPPGHWCLFGQSVSRRDFHTLDQDVKLFFALTNGLLDASIAVWECKRNYDYVRPVSAVRLLKDGKPIRAWGGPGRGTQLIQGERFQSYIPTPPFAEYVSGHSTFSSSSAEILKQFTGSDHFGHSVTLLPGTSRIEPGLVPAKSIILSWATFSEAADQAGMSRRLGGIHFEGGDLEGRALGRKIGVEAWRRAQTYFNGTTAP